MKFKLSSVVIVSFILCSTINSVPFPINDHESCISQTKLKINNYPDYYSDYNVYNTSINNDKTSNQLIKYLLKSSYNEKNLLKSFEICQKDLNIKKFICGGFNTFLGKLINIKPNYIKLPVDSLIRLYEFNLYKTSKLQIDLKNEEIFAKLLQIIDQKNQDIKSSSIDVEDDQKGKQPMTAAEVQQEEKEECPICLGDSEELEEELVATKCGHKFHAQCLNEWKEINSSCPLCRVNLNS